MCRQFLMDFELIVMHEMIVQPIVTLVLLGTR